MPLVDEDGGGGIRMNMLSLNQVGVDEADCNLSAANQAKGQCRW